MNDLRFAFRQLFKNPSFTIIALLSLALGIGGNCGIFTIINEVLFRPIDGVPSPANLVAVYQARTSSPKSASRLSYQDYLDFLDQNDVFSGLAAYGSKPISLVGPQGPGERVFAELVSADYFSVLGVPAVVGRTFLVEEARVNSSPVTVVSHSLWRRRFNSDPDLIGKTIQLNGQPFEVIGIASENYRGMHLERATSFWIPVELYGRLEPAASDYLESRGNRWLQLVGRLKPDVSCTAAQAALAVIADRAAKAHPETNTGLTATVLPFDQGRVPPRLRGAVSSFFAVLMVLAALVLLIACTNLANLLLARASARQREIGIRLALGANRVRLLQQLLTESLLLALAGGLLGLLVARWLSRFLAGFQVPMFGVIPLGLEMDWRVLAFTLLMTFLTALAFGLIPALQASRVDAGFCLKGSGTLLYHGPLRFDLRNLLIISQVTLSVVLLVVTGLFLRCLNQAQVADLGLDASNVLLMSMDLERQKYSEARGREFCQQLTTRLSRIPGVQAVSWASSIPFGDIGQSTVQVPGESSSDREGDRQIYYNVVGVDYLRMMGISTLEGRSFREDDRPGAVPVVVINQTAARRFWPGEMAIGRQMRIGGENRPMLEVIGVVNDTKAQFLWEKSAPQAFLPLHQHYQGELVLHVRTANPDALVPTALSEIRAQDPRLPIFDVKTMKQQIEATLFLQRMIAILTSAFSVLALFLAALGLYGVISYSVSRRTQEIGIRMALGAPVNTVVRSIVNQGLRLALIGLGMGFGIAAGFSLLLERWLGNVSPFDAISYGGVALLMVAVAAVASYVPARRAAKVDPMVALRYE